VIIVGLWEISIIITDNGEYIAAETGFLDKQPILVINCGAELDI
jgi:hypothetical protein